MLRQICLAILIFCMSVAHAEDQRVFRVLSASDGLADNSAQTIKCTKTGRMTITTLGNINFYDGAQFSYINTDKEKKYRLEGYHGDYRLYYDRFHHLWLKYDQEITCVNLTEETFITNMDSLFATIGMERQKVMDVFVDINGIPWLCGKGFVKNIQKNSKFPLEKGRTLQDLDVLPGNKLMLLYDNGQLVCYDSETGKKLFSNRAYDDEKAAGYNKSSFILTDSTGFYQIRKGDKGSILLRYDAQTKRWLTVMEPDITLNGMAMHDGVLYVASSKGYFTYDLSTGVIMHQEAVTLKSGRRLETNIQAVEFDHQGGMWIGTDRRGLLYARPRNAPFTVYRSDSPEGERYINMMADLRGITEFNGTRANVLYIDSRRWTWVGTSEGLSLYKSPQAEPVKYNVKKGLLNNVVHSIIEDNEKRVWVSTSNGISCLQVDGDSVRYVTSFGNADDVPNETFIDGKVMKLEDGRIVMQSIDNVVLFNPKDFKSLLNQEPSHMFPKLTSLLVNGAYVKVGQPIDGNVILTKAITRTKEINLNYDQNTLSLTFSALNFARPLQTYYRVKIKEMNKDYVILSYFNSDGKVDRRGLLHLPMVALRPGSYHIEVQASDVPDKWVGEPYEWIVNVNQPWWRASGMLMLLAFVLFSLLIVNFVLYNRNTRLRVKRNSDEGDMIRRIQNYAERCEVYNSEVIDVNSLQKRKDDKDSDLPEEFIELMVIVLPYIKEQGGKFTIRELVDLTGSDVTKFYQVVSSNMYKNPLTLVRALRLIQVQELLRTTNKSIEDIAMECNFASPNILISSFYHQFKLTPRDYRLST